MVPPVFYLASWFSTYSKNFLVLRLLTSFVKREVENGILWFQEYQFIPVMEKKDLSEKTIFAIQQFEHLLQKCQPRSFVYQRSIAWTFSTASFL